MSNTRLVDLDHLVMRQPTDAEREKMLELLGDWSINTSTDILRCDTLVTGRLPDIEHKLIPANCHNCGGRVDKDTMTCCYCGTYYM